MATASGTFQTGRGAAGDDWKERLGRVGLVGKGTLYAVIGLLAIQLALGDASQAGQQGAIEWIADQSFGKVLLVLLTVSLFALSAWRFLDAAVGDPVEGSETSDRAEYAVKAVVYLALAVGALSATIANWSGTSSSSSGGGSGGGSGSQQATATVLEWPGGRWLVMAAGLGLIAYAVYAVKKYAMDEAFLQRLGSSRPSWLEPAGRWGYAGRSIVYVVIGWFLFQAGLNHESGQTKGMSAALQEIAGKGWGQLVLWFVAVGLLAFGLFSLAEAKYRRAA